MALRTDIFDLGGLRLTSGEGRRLELEVALDPFELGGERYARRTGADPGRARRLQDDRRRLRAAAALRGSAGRARACAAWPTPRRSSTVDAREVSQPGGGDELESPYVEQGVLDLRAWARDALALALPAQMLCRPDCAGLCPVCGVDSTEAGPSISHEREPDPRWAKLSELKFDA